jgi:hypothetical protein
MRKMAIAAGAAALAISLAGCNSQTRTVENLPYCPAGADVCLEGMGVYTTPHISFVKGFVNVLTRNHPRAFTMYAFLYVRQPSGWKVQDEKTYQIGELPLKGQRRIFQPVMEAVCENRAWALDIHVVGTTSKGVHRSEWLVWPGANGRHGTFLGSESQIPQKYWPTRPALKCL